MVTEVLYSQQALCDATAPGSRTPLRAGKASCSVSSKNGAQHPLDCSVEKVFINKLQIDVKSLSDWTFFFNFILFLNFT